jgi:hypothetical protein
MRALPLIPTALLAAVLAPLPARAAVDFDFEIQPGAAQRDFKSVVEDIAAAANSKSLTPAEPAGITGFGIGAFATYVETDDPAAWERLIDEDVDAIGLVGVIVQKGLPLGLDVGASYAWVPGADGKVFGAELRYALVDGGIATPAVGLRASYSQLSGIDQLDYDGYGLDLSVSKGFGPATPYAGVGYVWSRFEADEQFDLDEEDVKEPRLFVGLRLSALIGITPEYERVGDRDAFNLRFGFAF